MEFAEFYTSIKTILGKLEQEESRFKSEIIKHKKENIILHYLELYIYSKLKFYFNYLEIEARQDNYILTKTELNNTIEILNTKQGLMEYIKSKYFQGETYKDRLTNNCITTYLKDI